MDKNILINNFGNFAHALPIRAQQKGFKVIHYSDNSPRKARELEKIGKIDYVRDGLNSGESVPVKTFHSLNPQRLSEIEYIILSNYSTEHKLFFEKYGEYLNQNQEIILLTPGVGGAYEMNNRLQNIGVTSLPKITEIDTCPFACKVPSLGKSYIKNEKNQVIYTSIQGKDSQTTSDSLVTKLFPQSKFLDNIFLGLDSRACMHVVGMLINKDRIQNQDNFNFYINPKMNEHSQIISEFDDERILVASQLGLNPRTIKQWLNIVYDVPIEDDLFKMIKNTPPYMDTDKIQNRSPAPKTLHHRYLQEEIPLKVVPTYYFGLQLGLSMPLHKKFIEQSGELLHSDKNHYHKFGRKFDLTIVK